MSPLYKKRRIEDRLVQNGIVTAAQLQQARDRQQQTGAPLGQVLIEAGFVAEDIFLTFLAKQLDIEFVDLKQFRFDVALVQRLQEIHARRYRAILLSEHQGLLTVGMADPMDLFAYDELVRILRQDVEVALVRESELVHAIGLMYRCAAEIAGYAEALEHDITEGRFDLAGNQKIDGCLSIMPTAQGASLVMRLEDQGNGADSLHQVGMSGNLLAQFRRMLHLPSGLILVTGPARSGKTTTLHRALQELNEAGKNIIMIGEISDKETADIAIRAATGGHLVLSTLHSPDVVSGAMRLTSMGVEGLLAAYSLRAVLAQRLLRRLCDNCAVSYEPDAGELAWLTATLGEARVAGLQLKNAGGCHYCGETGYRGRIGIFELLVMDEALSDALCRNDMAGFAQAVQSSVGYKPLVQVALEHAARGLTSSSEVFRVAEEVDASREFMKAKADQ